MVERCKYCGSAVAESDVSVTRFLCESYVNGGEWTQSPDCMAEELRTLRVLRDKVEAAPDVCGSVYVDGTLHHVEKWVPNDSVEVSPGAVQFKLVPVGDTP